VDLNKVKLIYFSPTRTTKKILEGIAQGIGADTVEHIDLTLPQAETKTEDVGTDELVLLGVPVYEGRVPQIALPRLEHIKANNTPAVLVVVYGNRNFDDALIELGDLAAEWGFVPVAGGAFVAEHSFATEDRHMANGRPDAEDIERAKDFGSKIREKMTGAASIDDLGGVAFPGNKPYRYIDRSPLQEKAATTIEETCTLCGTCEPLCPVGAITIEDKVKTDNMTCTLCCACVKSCPTGARVVDDPDINKIVAWVAKHFQERREPVTFI